MIRLLFISDFSLSKNGGIETHIKEIAQQLAVRGGYEIGYLIGEELEPQKVLGKNFISGSVLKKRIAELRPDFVHIHGFASVFIAQALAICQKLRLRITYTPHYHPFYALGRPGIGFFFYHAFHKRLISKVDALIALTNYEKNFFQKILPDDRIHVIPNGSGMTTGGASGNERRHAVLFVGRNDHNKRLDFLLNQKEFFLTHQLKCLVVTGDRCENEGPFEFFRNVSQEKLGELYETVKVVCIPSKYEAFSLVALEALSKNTAVIASDRVQIKEYFENKWYFTIFAYNNQDDFQKKLKMLLTEFDQHTEQFFLPSMHPFNWPGIVDQTCKVYGSVLGTSRGSRMSD